LLARDVMDSTTSTARKKLTLRMSTDDETRLEKLRERRKKRLAKADGFGPPDRMSRTALALHYFRIGMTQAEKAEMVTSDPTPPPDEDRP
jgi:hypothetical protein